MATQVSPGIVVQERDFTNSRLQETITNIGAIAGPFLKGDVGVAQLITSEKELVETFGKPTADNYEYWYTASEFLNYGGNLQVARIADTSGTNLTNANSAGVATVKINNRAAYEANIEGSAQTYDFVARTPGTHGNALEVVTIDRGADQIITLASGVAYSQGDAVTDGTATGVAYETNSGDTTKVSVVLDAGSAKFAQNGTVGGENVDSVADWYNEQYAVPGQIKWNALAPRPGTSPYAAARGGANDEIHVVVLDKTGGITGTANSVLEKMLYVSKLLVLKLVRVSKPL